MESRFLGNSDVQIRPVAMGCWPIAGMTSVNVNDKDSRATLTAAFESGVNFFDTAYCYGANGESERLMVRCSGPIARKLSTRPRGGFTGQRIGNASTMPAPTHSRRNAKPALRDSEPTMWNFTISPRPILQFPSESQPAPSPA